MGTDSLPRFKTVIYATLKLTITFVMLATVVQSSGETYLLRCDKVHKSLRSGPFTMEMEVSKYEKLSTMPTCPLCPVKIDEPHTMSIVPQGELVQLQCCHDKEHTKKMLKSTYDAHCYVHDHDLTDWFTCEQCTKSGLDGDDTKFMNIVGKHRRLVELE